MDFTTKLPGLRHRPGFRAPVPGGSLPWRALSAPALGNMVGSPTVGKKKYAAVETDVTSRSSCHVLNKTTCFALVERGPGV